MRPQYNIYPSLLDTFQGYLDSSEIYQQFWGFSENPTMTESEFEQKQFDDLINKINRVPFESEAANLGTAFNIACDYVVFGTYADDITDIIEKEGIISFLYKGQKYGFKIGLFDRLKKTYKYSAKQVYVEGNLSLPDCDVKLYGYADYATPWAWHDLKTTSKYKTGKYYKSWQRVVYPFCGLQMGFDMVDFQFDVIVWNKDDADFYGEFYRYVADIEVPRLIDICERFIDFLNTNRSLITDKKIFNEL